jgi:AraC-like DNA-binding protein
MIFEIYRPTYPLNGFVDHLFYFEGLSPAHALDRFLPDGNTEIIFDLTDDTQYVYDNESLTPIQACRHAWVSGVRTRPITIPSGRDSRLLVVAFRKGKAYPFYPLPIHEIADAVVGAELIFGKRVLDLRERLSAARSLNQMFLLVEKFLYQQAGDSICLDSSAHCIEYAVAEILRGPNVVSLQRLSDQIGYSQKHFIDLFKKMVGVSPKQYMRIMRFQNVIQKIENQRHLHWSEIALKSGYYDQAHLINDFKAFSGFTPGEYLKKKSPLLNYIPVG